MIGTSQWMPGVFPDHQEIAMKEMKRLAGNITAVYSGTTDASLFNGNAGLALFLSYYYQCFPSEGTKEAVKKQVEGIIDAMSEQPMGFNFVNGIAGIHWALQHINKLFQREILEEGFFDELHPLLETFIFNKLSEKNYDLLYGAMGGYLSLLEAEPAGNLTLHNRIYEALLDLSTYSSNGKYWWIDYLNKKTERTVNLGLAHGLPSLWHFLGLLYQHSHNPHIKEVLRSSIHSSTAFMLENSYSHYPIEIILNKQYEEPDPSNRRSSKLSWCYGDLCFAHALYWCGHLLQDDSMARQGILIAKQTLTRNTLEKAGLHDPCLCHGTTSCVHFYNRFFNYTGDLQFQQAANHWFTTGLQFRSDAGYHLLELEDDDAKLVVSPASILDGYTGIGLSYISFCAGIAPAWDRMLLLC